MRKRRVIFKESVVQTCCQNMEMNYIFGAKIGHFLAVLSKLLSGHCSCPGVVKSGNSHCRQIKQVTKRVSKHNELFNRYRST